MVVDASGAGFVASRAGSTMSVHEGFLWPSGRFTLGLILIAMASFVGSCQLLRAYAKWSSSRARVKPKRLPVADIAGEPAQGQPAECKSVSDGLDDQVEMD